MVKTRPASVADTGDLSWIPGFPGTPPEEEMAPLVHLPGNFQGLRSLGGLLSMGLQTWM